MQKVSASLVSTTGKNDNRVIREALFKSRSVGSNLNILNLELTEPSENQTSNLSNLGSFFETEPRSAQKTKPKFKYKLAKNR